MPTLEPCEAGLTIIGRPMSASARGRSAGLDSTAYSGAAKPAPDHDALGLELVHGERRGEHAAAGVGHAEPFERALHQSVLAAGAVQRDPGALEALAHQALHRPIARIERMRIDAAALQAPRAPRCRSAARSRARWNRRPAAPRPCRIPRCARARAARADIALSRLMPALRRCALRSRARCGGPRRRCAARAGSAPRCRRRAQRHG